MTDQIPPSRGTTAAQLTAMHLEAEEPRVCVRCAVRFHPTETAPGGTTPYGRFCPVCYAAYLAVVRPTQERHWRELEDVVRGFMADK